MAIHHFKKYLTANKDVFSCVKGKKMQNITNFISYRMKNIDTSEIRKVFDLASKIQNPINLSIGQPDYPVPEPVKNSLIKAINDNKNAYTPTQGIMPLREAISEKLYSENHFSAQPENIIISTGVASLIFLSFQSIFNEGDHILLIDPYFLIYEALAKYHKLNIHFLDENFTKEDIEHYKNHKDISLKAIIYSNPSNPTGKVFSREELTMLAELADTHGSIIIADELYEKLIYHGKHVSMGEIYSDNILLFNGFSKSHAMTGLRVGYAAASEKNASIINNIATLQQYSIVCSPQPAQWAAITALKTPLDNEISIMKERNKMVTEKLSGKIKFTNPEGAFYVFPQIPVDGMKFSEEAIKKKLLIVPGNIFSRNNQTIRISYAQKNEILERGLEIFLNLINELTND